jgi:hypothetical protein
VTLALSCARKLKWGTSGICSVWSGGGPLRLCMSWCEVDFDEGVITESVSR